LLIGNEVDVFLRAYMLETVVGPLYQGAAGTQQIQELLRVMGPAFRPEPAADTAGHYSNVIVLYTHDKKTKDNE